MVSITNSTLTANTATGGAGGAAPGTGLPGTAGRGLGGALFNRSGTATLLNATLANNNADAGGALFNLGEPTTDGDPATVHLTNSILAGTSNSATDFDSATLAGGSVFTNGGYNLIQNNPALGGYVASPFASFLTGLDPLLAPLADNGGPTPTMALLPGSSALDAAFASAAPATDQRGVRRVNAGSNVDLGAFEDPLS